MLRLAERRGLVPAPPPPAHLHHRPPVGGIGDGRQGRARAAGASRSRHPPAELECDERAPVDPSREFPEDRCRGRQELGGKPVRLALEVAVAGLGVGVQEQVRQLVTASNRERSASPLFDARITNGRVPIQQEKASTSSVAAGSLATMTPFALEEPDHVGDRAIAELPGARTIRAASSGCSAGSVSWQGGDRRKVTRSSRTATISASRSTWEPCPGSDRASTWTGGSGSGRPPRGERSAAGPWLKNATGTPSASASSRRAWRRSGGRPRTRTGRWPRVSRRPRSRAPALKQAAELPRAWARRSPSNSSRAVSRSGAHV